MSSSSRNPQATTEHSFDEQIRLLGARFEASWRAVAGGAAPPSLESYLLEIPVGARPQLRAVLETIENRFRVGTATTDELTVDPHSSTVDRTPARPAEANATMVQQGKPAVAFAGATVAPEHGVRFTTPTGRTGAPASSVQVPGYEILGELGRGAMGVVYKARQLGLKRLVALKMVLSGAHATPEQRERFVSEAQAVAQLQHPNIVQIFEVGEHDGLPFFSLEFVDGGSLDRQTAREPQPARKSAEMLQTLARAMDAAHRRGIIHRDLKPANVLLGADGTLKISDFGLAKRVEDDAGQTRSGAVLGTPAYMSPEQANADAEAIGPASDVYALGAMLYEFLTGRPPLMASSILQLLELVRKQEPLPPARLVPDVPRDLETICLKCLQKEPGRRYTSAGELADDLGRFLDGRPILARPVSRVERSWRWCQRNPRLALALAASVLLLIGWGISMSVFAAALAHERDAKEGERLAAVDAREKEATAHRATEEAKQKEEKAHQAEKSAREEADKQAELATTQTNLALEGIKLLVITVQQKLQQQGEKPPDLADLRKLREELLQITLKQLNGVSGAAGKTQIIDRRKAGGHQRIGEIYLQLGVPLSALREYERSFEILLALEKQEPKAPVHKRNLAAAHNNLADVHLVLGQTEKAEEHYRAALDLRQKWLDLEPTNDTVKQALAKSYGLVGNALLLRGRPAEARPLFEECRKRYQALPAALLNGVQEQRELAGLTDKLGDTSFKLGDVADALREYEDGLKRRTALSTRLSGKNLPVRRDIGLSHLRLGDVQLLLAKNPAKGREHYALALAQFGQILQLDPDSAISQRDVATAHYRLGVAALARVEPSAAQTHFQEARKRQQVLADRAGDSVQAKTDLMLVLARCDEHLKASQLAAELEAKAGKDARTLSNVGCGYALCAGAAGGRTDPTSLTPEQRSAVDKYTLAALNALGKAADNGWNDAQTWRLDPDLVDLQNHPEFVALLARLK